MDDRVRIASARGAIVYEDDRDHYENGFLRLLAIDERDLVRWIEVAEEAEGDLEAKLAAGFRALRPEPPSLFRTHRIVPAEGGSIAFLEKLEGGRELDPPIYEEAYFQGDRSDLGYGDYLAQQGWRLEKA